MDIPIDLCLPRKLRIRLREETRGDIGGNDDIYKLVEAESGKDLVDMKG